ncbi:Predicted arabinose efflux permease, MFS family [Cupriavidus sp. YR651]|uniref:MFS transporter n=1 Tax=Cupriavidus sp. YR651 TaxID=1855315 RepID=UPI00088D2A4C|nr:MFS transporter [Cupriavidus sp. YR651]SDD93346.1 Predicted arabinose efflux permease, MFS family [Cupriavidus sp. YR651]
MDKRLIVLASGMFAIGTDSFVVAGVLSQVSASLGVSVALAGQMVTLYAMSYALLSPVIAAAAAHWPRKRLLLAGLAVFVLGNVLTAVAPSIGLVLASRLIAGLGAAMFSPTATATGASLVPPEQRGRALAIVVAGLSSATALGAPLGTFIGGWLDWRATMWFVAAVGTLAAMGVAWRLRDIPTPPPVTLARRLAPLGDARVLLTLLTTLLAYSGLFLVYTYIGSSFDRATGGDARVLAGLLLLWGVAATVGNLAAGRMTDRFGSRRIINAAIAIVALDFALLPWTSASLVTAVPALVIWGLCGWGLLVPQQHRLISITPAAAPLLLGLNSAAIYVGVSMSGLLGGAAITWIDPHALGLVGAVSIAVALLVAEWAQARIARPEDLAAGTVAAPQNTAR